MLLSAGEAVPSNEQQRGEAVPLPDHRVSAHQLPGTPLFLVLWEQSLRIVGVISVRMFQTDRPTVIEYDDHEYLFEGFSLFSHKPLTNVSYFHIECS